MMHVQTHHPGGGRGVEAVTLGQEGIERLPALGSERVARGEVHVDERAAKRDCAGTESDCLWILRRLPVEHCSPVIERRQRAGEPRDRWRRAQRESAGAARCPSAGARAIDPGAAETDGAKPGRESRRPWRHVNAGVGLSLSQKGAFAPARVRYFKLGFSWAKMSFVYVCPESASVIFFSHPPRLPLRRGLNSMVTLSPALMELFDHPTRARFTGLVNAQSQRSGAAPLAAASST